MLIRITTDRRLYIGRWRVHHGPFGLLVAAAGALIAWDDRHDWPWSPR